MPDAMYDRPAAVPTQQAGRTTGLQNGPESQSASGRPVLVLRRRTTDWNRRPTKNAAAKRPHIHFGGDMMETTQAAWDALLRVNSDNHELFVSGDRIVRVRHSDLGTMVAEPLNDHMMRHHLARCAVWLDDSSRTPEPAPVPMIIARDILADPSPRLDPLRGIADTPRFGEDGKLIREAGYHRPSGLFYAPDPKLTLPNVPEHPTNVDVARARTILLEHLLGEFPFDGPENGAAEKAHAVCLLIQPFVRELIDGATPVFVITKPEPGTGAGLLADCVSIAATGAPAAPMTERREDDEMRKTITAFLLSHAPILFLDNVNRKIESGALASAITADTWVDRILGTSQTKRIPVRHTWLIAGNNVRTSREIARRCVRIQLNARVARPELRTFHNRDLQGWARKHRGDIVWACLTLAQAWIAAGRRVPGDQAPRLGSFYSWSDVMGGILATAGIPGFLGNLEEAAAANDPETEALNVFVQGWFAQHGTEQVTTAQLYKAANQQDPPLAILGVNDQGRRSSFGSIVSSLENRRFEVEKAVGDDGALRRRYTVNVRKLGYSGRALVFRLEIQDRG